MSDRIDISASPVQGELGVPPGIRRLLLIGSFVLLIVITLLYGLAALKLLSARSTQMAGPQSPVTDILDRLEAALVVLTLDSHPELDLVVTPVVPMIERLQPVLTDFRAAHIAWLRFSETDLAIDVLLARQLKRQLGELDQQFRKVAGPFAGSPDPSPRAYDRLQRMALITGDLIDQTRSAHLATSRVQHGRDMQEIRDTTRNFVYLGALALVGFIVLSVLYLWQMRRYDRHIHALSELSSLLSSTSGIPLFEGMVSFLGRELGHAYVFIGQLNPGDPQQIDTLAVYAHGKLAGNISYRLPGTPCENVLQRGVCFHPSGVQKDFPDDRLLQEMGVDSYAGTPLLNAQDKPLGILVLLDSISINPANITSSLIQLIASRAQTELERMRAEALRTNTLDGLEARVDQRQPRDPHPHQRSARHAFFARR